MATARDSIGAKLFLNESHADVWFLIDGEEIPGHKAILSLDNPYFEAVLCDRTKEAQAMKIVVPHSKATFIEVLRFCYLKDIAITNWTVQDLIGLLHVAREYQLEPLVGRVADIIANHLSVDVLSEVFGAAKLLDLPKLVAKCMLVAGINVQRVLNSSIFKDFSVDLVCALIGIPAFCAHSRELLAAVSTWKTCHTESELRMVLKQVDWQKVSQVELSSITEDFITTHPDVLNLPFWEKLKLGGASQKGGSVELLTWVKYEYDSGKVVGSLLYSAVRETHYQASSACQAHQCFGCGLNDLNLTFKGGARFRIDRVEISGPGSVQGILFNGQSGQLYSTKGDMRTARVAKFTEAACVSKQEQDNLLHISGVGSFTSCEVSVHGTLYRI